MVILFLVLLPCAAGCGLSAYEEKMAKEQKRLEAFDAEENTLGELLELPVRKEGGKNIDLFFRLPRGMDAKNDLPGSGAQGQALPLGDIFFCYPRRTPTTGDGSSAKNDADAIMEIYLAVTDGSRDKFRKDTLLHFESHLSKPLSKEFQQTGRKTLQFDSWESKNNNRPQSTYFIYHHQSGKYLVAIVFRVAQDQAGAPAVMQAIERSLQTLVVGEQAVKMLQNYRSRSNPAGTQ